VSPAQALTALRAMEEYAALRGLPDVAGWASAALEDARRAPDSAADALAFPAWVRERMEAAGLYWDSFGRRWVPA
jgi:hypothetical protein